MNFNKLTINKYKSLSVVNNNSIQSSPSTTTSELKTTITGGKTGKQLQLQSTKKSFFETKSNKLSKIHQETSKTSNIEGSSNPLSGGQENFDMMPDCARGVHVSRSGRLKPKQFLRSRVLSFDGATVASTFEPPSFHRGTVSADNSNVKNIFPSSSSSPSSSLSPSSSICNNDKQQEQIQQRKSPKISLRSFSIESPQNNSSVDLRLRKTGFPMMSLSGVEIASSQL